MNRSHSLDRLWAAVIVFHPNLERLRRAVQVIAPQVQRVLILDNTPNMTGLAALCAELGVAYMPMHENLGTGYAMNRAWEQVIAENADGLICFDQDSDCGATLIAALRQSWDLLTQKGADPGAIGPVWRDQRSGKMMTTLTPNSWLRKPVNQAPQTEVDHLITSGCLIPREVFQAVGPFKEAFFLDCVDTEWSLRARSKGYRLFVAKDAELSHTIGEELISLGAHSLMVHAPWRTHLMVRNHILLWRSPWLGLRWKIRDAGWVLIRALALVLLAPEKGGRMKAIFQAIWDGLKGKSGKVRPIM